jgi:hypothetical protein
MFIDNIQSSSEGEVDQAMGTVTLDPGIRSVRVMYSSQSNSP